jgi:hypothetical protein
MSHISSAVLSIPPYISVHLSMYIPSQCVGGAARISSVLARARRPRRHNHYLVHPPILKKCRTLAARLARVRGPGWRGAPLVKGVPLLWCVSGASSAALCALSSQLLGQEGMGPRARDEAAFFADDDELSGAEEDEESSLTGSHREPRLHGDSPPAQIRCTAVAVMVAAAVVVVLLLHGHSPHPADAPDGRYVREPSEQQLPVSFAEQMQRRASLLAASAANPVSPADPRFAASGISDVSAPAGAWYLYQPAWSCPDHELIAGVWVCGARRLAAPCVVYSFSDSSHALAAELKNLTDCVVRTFGGAQGSDSRVSLGASSGTRLARDPYVEPSFFQWGGESEESDYRRGGDYEGGDDGKTVTNAQLMSTLLEMRADVAAMDEKLGLLLGPRAGIAATGEQLGRRRMEFSADPSRTARFVERKSEPLLVLAPLQALMASHGDETVDLLYLDTTGDEWEVLPLLRYCLPACLLCLSNLSVCLTCLYVLSYLSVCLFCLLSPACLSFICLFCLSVCLVCLPALFCSA